MHRFAVPLCLFLLVSVGCVGLPASETPKAGETPPTPSNWTSGDVRELPSETVATLTVGDESDLPDGRAAHTYRIGNNHSESRSVAITVWRDSTVVIDRSVTFQPNSSVRIETYRPGSYTLVVDPENASRHVIDDPGRWDCNALDLMVNIHPDGRISGWWVQTSVAC